jgi:hypothetical protein
VESYNYFYGFTAQTLESGTVPVLTFLTCYGGSGSGSGSGSVSRPIKSTVIKKTLEKILPFSHSKFFYKEKIDISFIKFIVKCE